MWGWQKADLSEWSEQHREPVPREMLFTSTHFYLVALQVPGQVLSAKARCCGMGGGGSPVWSSGWNSQLLYSSPTRVPEAMWQGAAMYSSFVLVP